MVNIYGCGPGRAGLALSLKGYEVHMLDIARNALDAAPAVAITTVDTSLYFHVGQIKDAVTLLPQADVGYCCDVLEHLPPADVLESLRAIRVLTPRAYMTICHVKDGFGPRYLKEPLHLTIQPHAWWLAQIESVWPKEARIEFTQSTCTSTYTVEIP